MIIYLMLKAAIKRKELEATKILLQANDPSLLMRFGVEDASVVNELATHGLLEAIKELRKINPLLLTHHSRTGRTGFTEAICFNHPHVVNYLVSAQLFSFPTRLHQDAYFGKLKSTTVICAEKTKEKDSAERIPLFYAVAGGHSEAVTTLLAATPAKFFNLSELVRVAVVSRNRHLLPLLTSKLKLEDCSAFNAKMLLIAIREFADEPMVLINQLLTELSEDIRETLQRSLIIEATKGEGHHAITEYMIKRYKPDDLPARAVLLHDLSNVLSLRKPENPTYELDFPVDDNVFAGFTDDMVRQPELLHKVLTSFIIDGYEEGVRSVSRSLPVEIIRSVVTDKEKKYQKSLIELARKYQRETAYFLLISDDQSDKKEFELRTFFQHVVSFARLMAGFRQARKIDGEKAKWIVEKLNAIREAVLLTNEDSKGIVIARELNFCIAEIWKTVAVFCSDEKEKENLRVLFDIVMQFMKLTGLPVSVFHFCRGAHLAFALGNLEEAKKLHEMVNTRFTQEIIGQKQKEEKDPACVLLTAMGKVTIAVLQALNVNVEPHLQEAFMREWVRTCNVFFVGDSALLQTEPPIFTEKSLQLAVKAIPDSALSSVRLKKLQPEEMESLFYLRNAMSIKSNILLFRGWINKYEKNVAPTIPRDMSCVAH